MRARRSIPLVVAVLLVALAGCSSAPQNVLQVPFTYTFGQQTILSDTGPLLIYAGGSVVMCTDTHGPLDVVAGPWGSHFFELDFDGVTYQSGEWPRDVPWTTPAVGPGCGTLEVQPFTTTIQAPTSVVVTVTKA